jgi:hypothetical protein
MSYFVVTLSAVRKVWTDGHETKGNQVISSKSIKLGPNKRNIQRGKVNKFLYTIYDIKSDRFWIKHCSTYRTCRNISRAYFYPFF